MVGEFPELQGVMGGYYAAAQGQPPEVAEAIRDHYKPIGQGDEAPTAPVTVAVSLADKLDTISRFFLIAEPPSGSKDPFALRRAALGIIALILRNDLRFRLESALLAAVGDDLDEFEAVWRDHTEKQLASFFADRLKVQQREAGVRHDLIEAVFALGGEDDLVRLLARVHALQAFVGTEDGANLLAGYKRAANILKKEGYFPSPPMGEVKGLLAPARGKGEGDVASPNPPHPSASPLEAGTLPSSPTRGEGLEPAEAALHVALDAAAPAAADAIAREDFSAAMAALATLRAPIDAFFDQVTVNDADPATRARRLALLDRVRRAVHGVADFSRIEG